MEHWAPLIQTLLWVVLIGSTIVWAREPLLGILKALQKRIESGSNIKAGPFSIEDLKPQTPEQQAEKIQTELIAPAKDAATSSEPKIIRAPTTDAMPTNLPNAPSQVVDKLNEVTAQLDTATKTLDRVYANTSQAQAFLAEDLALRTIQSDFKVPVQRQVTGGRDGGFDGVFEVNGQIRVVEVKYIGKRADPTETAERIGKSLQRLLRDTSNYGWSSSEIILAAVFATAGIPPEHKEAIDKVCRELGRVTPRFYTLGKLKRQWGMDGEDWEDKIYR